MKNHIILWTAAVIITYLVVYFGNVTGGYYPLTGTIGVNGEKVSFQFDRLYRGNTDYDVLVRKDVKDASAVLHWKKEGDKNFSIIEMKDSGEVFKAAIPLQKPYTKIIYRAEIVKDGKRYFLPYDRNVDMVMIGKVHKIVMGLYYFFLFGAILLSVRAALEYFNNNSKTKVYAMFTAIFVFCYTIAVTPLKTTYEMNAILHSVPSPEKLFNLQSVVLLAVWIAGMVMIIGKKNPGFRAIIFAVLTILVYLLIPIRF